MGINGLHPIIKSITRPIRLDSLKGLRVAVDAYSWLHKGAYACAVDLALGKPTSIFVEYCLSKLRVLNYYKITAVFVFDGAPLPSKLHTDDSRQK